MHRRIGVVLLITGGLLFFMGFASAGYLSTVAFVQPSVYVTPANIVIVQPYGIESNIGGQPGSMQVMVQIQLGSYSENLVTFTGGPPGYCNGGSCDTAIFNPITTPPNYSPLTISWGDGTTGTIYSYWLDMNNLNTFTIITPPGDGLAGYAVSSYEVFYHTYASAGTYVIQALPVANGPITSASYTAGSVPPTTTTTTLTTTNPVTTQTSIITTGGTTSTTTLTLPPTSTQTTQTVTVTSTFTTTATSSYTTTFVTTVSGTTSTVTSTVTSGQTITSTMVTTTTTTYVKSSALVSLASLFFLAGGFFAGTGAVLLVMGRKGEGG